MIAHHSNSTNNSVAFFRPKIVQLNINIGFLNILLRYHSPNSQTTTTNIPLSTQLSPLIAPNYQQLLQLTS
jgi:hypothetical protein